MRIETYRDAERRETHFVVILTDRDLVTAPLDATDRWILGSPKEHNIADTLQDLQLIAFRIEQAQAAKQ